MFDREGLENALEEARDIAGDLETRVEKLEELLHELRDWFDGRADAEYDLDGGMIPNEEMRALCRIDEVL